MSAAGASGAGDGAAKAGALYRGRPSAWWILLAWPLSLVIPFLLVYGANIVLRYASLPAAADWALWAAWAIVILGVAWRAVEWLSRRYVVTADEAIIRAGVITKVGADLPLRNVQHVTLYRTLMEQVLGLGSIGIATAGSDGPVAYLVMVRKPEKVLALVREAAAAARSGVALPTDLPGRSPQRPIVIGLAGGIAAGKSAVARVFAERGAVVIDSDKEAKDALDRPEVRGELIRWWGDGVLAADGRIDRKKVGSIIFADQSQRERLERLVHPLVRANRSEMIARADPRTTPAIVVDAPLLYEVGLDRECDTVVFVDAPREQRLARANETRGWDEAELTKREKAQIPVEVKRGKADYLIANDASLEELRSRAHVAFSEILAKRR